MNVELKYNLPINNKEDWKGVDTYELNRKLAAQKELQLTNINLWSAKKNEHMCHKINGNVEESFYHYNGFVNHYIFHISNDMDHKTEGINIVYN